MQDHIDTEILVVFSVDLFQMLWLLAINLRKIRSYDTNASFFWNTVLQIYN